MVGSLLGYISDFAVRLMLSQRVGRSIAQISSERVPPPWDYIFTHSQNPATINIITAIGSHFDKGCPAPGEGEKMQKRVCNAILADCVLRG